MASSFMENYSERSSESDEESSNNSSLSSVVLSEDDSDNLEPLATETETAEYVKQVEREEEEEAELIERFNGVKELSAWCKCTQCSTEHSVKHTECSCCVEYDRCREKMYEIDRPNDCISSQPAFENICLDTWVLEVAAIGLRTKNKAHYTTLRTQGQRIESEFFRSVAYRQFVRFVYDYVGNSRRIPLPCCVYNKIRSKFPSEDQMYKGFEEEESEEEIESEEESELDSEDEQL